MYDYVIVGAGSAGCALANRLSADPSVRVLLLEAGPRDSNPFIRMPAGIARLVENKRINWDYHTEPQPQLDGRRLWWPRGKVLGGSSSINAMCYIRGHRRDYDDWAAAGAQGWDFESVLPYFRRAEDNQRGADPWHGGDGPMAVSDLRYRNPLSAVFVEAAGQAGHPRNPDFNDATLDGFGYYQVTQRDGMRCSSASAYLEPVRARTNLKVLTGAQVTRLKLEHGRVTAVHYLHRGQPCCEGVEREVILSGGTINSPQLLMLSGIGPADRLRAHGIEVAHDLPGVGANLHDHLDICTLQHCLQPITYDRASNIVVALRYALFRSGAGTSNIAEAGGFVRSRLARDDRPDVQFHFVPAMLDDHGRNRLPGYGYTVHACALRPHSRGRIELASGDPLAPPRIQPDYLGDPEGHDLAVMLEGIRLSREILAQAAFAPYRGEEIHPGADARDEAALTAFVRAKAETIYHPVGTCRIGQDAMAVVDPQLRVRGIQGLRVADASVMPTLPGGNTNAPAIMIGERASDLILGCDAGAATPQSRLPSAAAL
ncbi:MAG TPA: choline dehydrogenase [Xanthomonadaceae bacterium]|nr:choline dehydrogenase [Xanthomonadaceae bacterium]